MEGVQTVQARHLKVCQGRRRASTTSRAEAATVRLLRRAIATISALFGGGGALYLAIWQSTTLFDACLSTQCLPGPGVMLLLGAGALGLLQALSLFRDRPSA